MKKVLKESWILDHHILLVNLLLSFSSFPLSGQCCHLLPPALLLLWFNSGFTAEIVTHFSAASASVMVFTPWASAIDCKISRSCHEVDKCAEALSSLKTSLTASICSSILSTTSYAEPHHVTTSTLSLCIGVFAVVKQPSLVASPASRKRSDNTFTHPESTLHPCII